MVTRFGISLEEELLKELDAFVEENSFSSRSHAIRFLIEKNIAEKKWQCNNNVAGAILLMYDFSKREISEHISQIQHDYRANILASQKFFLDNNICLETVTVKGSAKKLTELSGKLITIKGVKHGKLLMGRVD